MDQQIAEIVERMRLVIGYGGIGVLLIVVVLLLVLARRRREEEVFQDLYRRGDRRG
jgi:hypothetical protein